MSRLSRLIIADKNPLVLKGLAGLLEEDARFDVVAAVDSGQAFLDAADSISFDVGVVGWMLPDMDSGAVLRQLRERACTARIVVYTGSRNPDVPRQVLRLGGYGFCSKSDPPEMLLDTIGLVAWGRMSFPYVDVRKLNEDPLAHLTARETELLSALASGWTNIQIANRLGISQNTVKFHLKNLYEKLDVRNRAMAVALFVARRNDSD